jgi:cytidine deaminase
MWEELIRTAIRQMDYAYAPYSEFKVGAALLCSDGRVFTGCNIENSAFGPSNCAERTAIFKAVSEGVRDFKAIAIVGGKNGRIQDYCAPCGVCRQVMLEFCIPEAFQIIMAKSPEDYQVCTLAELLPRAFSPKMLEGKAYEKI